MKKPTPHRPDNGEDPAVTPKPADAYNTADSGGNSPTPPKPPKTVEPEYTPLSGGHGGTVPPKVESPGN